MQYNLKHFAHIGDAVFELFVREHIINFASDQKIMHKMTIKFVNSNFQAEILNNIQELLTEEEKELARRGRNLPITINKKSNPQIHRMATSFEVLIGFWYLNDKERLDFFLENIKKYLNV